MHREKPADMVVRFTPVGVFAIAASAAGTMTVTEFGRLQAYLLTHTGHVDLLFIGAWTGEPYLETLRALQPRVIFPMHNRQEEDNKQREK